MNASAAFLRKETNSDQVRGRSKSEASVIDRWSASQLMGFFRTRYRQAARRSDRSFGSSDQGPARPFASAGGSISRNARRSRVRLYPSRGSPIPRNTGTLVRKNFGGISTPNKRAYVRSMTGWYGAWDPTTQPAIPRRNRAAS